MKLDRFELSAVVVGMENVGVAKLTVGECRAGENRVPDIDVFETAVVENAEVKKAELHGYSVEDDVAENRFGEFARRNTPAGDVEVGEDPSAHFEVNKMIALI